ncbi:MAG: Cold-shock domain-containing protein [Candidatus Moranbacteria bacterium GW2011_GWE1_35_17]|nr:MAG: Cold-shock domain-containing protein [Candidatus Moranbacteria bacterium GW2011_GWE1_35_17]KKP72739.1 MAG: Cold-shock domain-containing protein [Candidatus Moranbacteria bacterium GW2011_GWE2_35_164]KKP81919.1 MAG: Cold-shock domain-containing protein [Candidatus Moranbacteria bacterium GW2011_GWF1_35_5]KKP85207.1 MAG: Cold-shock domain-containing protein [Candidatus Moranbacteria bacterium GW2011_GWF2_35_54]
MDINFLMVAIVYLIINIGAFLAMMLDKVKSRKGKAKAERISEGILFFMAAAFGSAGVYLGMFVFHHKNRKWHFILGIPLLMLQNIVFLSVLYNFFNSLQ